MRTLFFVTLIAVLPALSRSAIPAEPEQDVPASTTVDAALLGIAPESESVVEGENFRVWCSDRHLAQQVLVRAEESRVATVRDWLSGESLEPWRPRCDIYLDGARNKQLSLGRGSPNSAGQALIVKDGHRVLRRKIVLDSADAKLLDAIVPHEVAHIVLGGYFSNAYIPSWADEGVAMLNEPLYRQREYLIRFGRWEQHQGAKSCDELVRGSDITQVHKSEEFYGRAFLLTSFLMHRGGSEQLIYFLESAMATDDATALRLIYGITDFDELDTDLNRFAATVASELLKKSGCPVPNCSRFSP